MKRLTLGVNGTTLTFPKFGRKIRLSAVHVVAAAGAVTLAILNGAGVAAFVTTVTAGASATFANAFSVTNTDLEQIPPDLWIEETDDIRLTFAAATVSAVVVSYQEKGE